MRARIFLLALGLWAALFLSTPANAACNALAGCSCTVTTTGISFGNYDPIGSANNDATGTIRVQCLLLVALFGSYTIDLSAGNSGTYTGRQLRNGTNSLTYNLYTTATRNQVQGDGNGGSVNVTRNFLALLVVDDTTTVYGRIPGGQNVRAGPYTDTVVITVTY